MSLHADATRVLTQWAAPGQEALRQGFLGFLAARPDAMARACEPGHLTASTVVLDSDARHVLLTLHPRVGAWLQLGGHCERDPSLAEAALREATEESGIPGLVLDPVPVRLDIHPITCSLGVPTRHFDVQYVAVAPAGATPVISSESADLRWWPVDALPDGTDVGAVVEAAVRRFSRGVGGAHIAR
jgi:8-oxo-dGTP pyrophosphatase MutT (NUDIX family)